MKNYLLSPNGLQQIEDKHLSAIQAQGGFMNSSGPASFPQALELPHRQAVELLLAKKQNFVFWFTADFKVVFITRDGAISSNGKWWRIRFEWRSVTKDGVPAPSIARFDRKIPVESIAPILENAFPQMEKNLFQAAQAADPRRAALPDVSSQHARQPSST